MEQKNNELLKISRQLLFIMRVVAFVILVWGAEKLGGILSLLPKEFLPSWGIVVAQLGIIVVGIVFMAGEKEFKRQEKKKKKLLSFKQKIRMLIALCGGLSVIVLACTMGNIHPDLRMYVVGLLIALGICILALPTDKQEEEKSV